MNWLREKLSVIYIFVFEQEGSWSFFAKLYKKHDLIATFDEQIESEAQAHDYLEELISRAYFSYVCVLVNSIAQGALPNSSRETFKAHDLDFKEHSYFKTGDICIYAAKSELAKCKKLFKSVDVDVIFSPFSLLYKSIKNRGFSQTTCCYVLRYSRFVCVMIFTKEEFRLGNFFYIQDTASPAFDASNQNEDDEEFADLDDLSFDKLDDLSIDSDLSSDGFSIFGEEESEDLTKLASDMKLKDYLFTLLSEFYENKLYESDFLEEIVIFEEDKTARSVLGIIESDLLIKPELVHIDLRELVLNTIQEELL